jgi:hypothetical protein
MFKAGKFVDSVRFCITSVDARFCPLCDAPPNAQCGCKFPVLRPVHPLDFSRNRSIMSTFTGEYLGTTRATAVLPSGVTDPEYVSASLMSRMRVNGYGRGDARHEEVSSLLCAFAIQLSLADASPARGLMPRIPLITAGTDNMDFTTPAASSNESPEVDNTFAPVSAGPDFGTGVDLMFGAASSAPIHEDVVTSFSMDGLGMPSGAAIGFGDLSPGLDFTAPGTSSTIPGGLPGSDVSRADEEVLDTAARSGSGSTGASISFDDGRNSLDEGRGFDHAPALPLNADEQALRNVRRRMKNREAAARSNARRKAKNDILKKGLTDAKQEAVELRRKEMLLREENLTLRRQIYTPGSMDGQG